MLDLSCRCVIRDAICFLMPSFVADSVEQAARHVMDLGLTSEAARLKLNELEAGMGSHVAQLLCVDGLPKEAQSEINAWLAAALGPAAKGPAAAESSGQAASAVQQTLAPAQAVQLCVLLHSLKGCRHYTAGIVHASQRAIHGLIAALQLLAAARVAAPRPAAVCASAWEDCRQVLMRLDKRQLLSQCFSASCRALLTNLDVLLGSAAPTAEQVRWVGGWVGATGLSVGLADLALPIGRLHAPD